MKLTKIEPKYLKKNNPRVGLITLATDFRIEKDFNNVIYGKDIDLYCNRIKCHNPLTNETLKKMADDIPKVAEDILPDQKLDCVAYGCTSGTIAAGYQSIHDKVNSVKPNTKVTTPITSAINALKSLKKRFEIYKDAKSKAENRDVALGEGISLVRDMFVAETMEEAEKLAGEHIINYMRWVCHWRGLGNHMDPGEELPETKHKLDLLNYDFLHKRNLLFGTPEYVVNKINELKSELNLQNLQVWSNFPGIDHKACMRSIKLFNDEVIPKINFDNDDIEKAS